jgi:hypothetical protein
VTSDTEHKVAAAVAFARSSCNLFAIISSTCLLAHLHRLQGRLRQAASIYRQAMWAVPRPEVLQTAPGSLFYYFGRGERLREWNGLGTTEQHLT